jgi:hypothetical protein
MCVLLRRCRGRADVCSLFDALLRVQTHVYRRSRTTALRNREVVSIPDRTSRTGAGKRKAPAASNRSAAHNVARRIAGRRSVAVLLRALLRAAS